MNIKRAWNVGPIVVIVGLFGMLLATPLFADEASDKQFQRDVRKELKDLREQQKKILEQQKVMLEKIEQVRLTTNRIRGM